MSITTGAQCVQFNHGGGMLSCVCFCIEIFHSCSYFLGHFFLSLFFVCSFLLPGLLRAFCRLSYLVRRSCWLSRSARKYLSRTGRKKKLRPKRPESKLNISLIVWTWKRPATEQRVNKKKNSEKTEKQRPTSRQTHCNKTIRKIKMNKNKKN